MSARIAAAASRRKAFRRPRGSSRARAALAALGLLASAAGVAADRRLAMQRFGPVRVGMTVREAAAAAGWTPSGGGAGADSPECRFVSFAEAPGVRFLVEGGRIRRADLAGGSRATLSGLRIGDAEARAREIYGARVAATPHKYLEGGRYLTWKSSDGRFALVLESDGEKIVAIRAGARPAAEYVEGCG